MGWGEGENSDLIGGGIEFNTGQQSADPPLLPAIDGLQGQLWDL